MQQLFEFVRQYFVIDIQRIWRGYRHRKKYRAIVSGMVKIQSALRGYRTRKGH